MKNFCHRCKSELKQMGALLFSPPDTLCARGTNPPYSVEKFHLCVSCFNILTSFLESDRKYQTEEIKNLKFKNECLAGELQLACNIASALMDEQTKLKEYIPWHL